jgi:hypothetical protein
VNLTTIIHSERITIRRHESHYQSVREGEPAFAPYATTTALLESLSTESPLDLEQRQPIVRAAILASQRSRHPLWAAVLLCAFEPMLRNLRARVNPSSPICASDRDELDQQVVVAFLETIRAARVDGEEPVFAAVRRRTAYRLFGSVRADREFAEMVSFDELSPECAPNVHADPGPFVQVLAREVAEIMAKREGGADVALSLAGAETLAEQAERLGVPEIVNYECLRKRRRRAIKQVRDELKKSGPEDQ